MIAGRGGWRLRLRAACESGDGGERAKGQLSGTYEADSQIIDFAKTRSDAVVEKQDGEEALEAWKKERLADKSESHRGLGASCQPES